MQAGYLAVELRRGPPGGLVLEVDEGDAGAPVGQSPCQAEPEPPPVSIPTFRPVL